MEEKRTLLTYHDLTVEVETAPGEELLDHLHSTLLGQPGGLRYQHTNLSERLSAPGENYFMYLRKGGKMLGSVGFCGKPAEVDGISFDTWLIRYFSIKAPMRTDPEKRKEDGELKERGRSSSVLGRFTQPIASNPSLLRGADEAEPAAPAVMYGMIEKKNLRSMNFSAQMGLETVGEMAGFSFSRMKPRCSARMEQLEKTDQEPMLSLLKDYYKEYTLLVTDPLFRNDDYYVIKDGGSVVAGIQIYHVTWKISDFGSGTSNRMVRLITRIPWVRKRFKPDELRFLAFDGIYCEPGYESALYELMEGVLFRTGTFVAMMMMDANSDLYKIFLNKRKLGALHRVVGTFSADIRVRFINLPEKIRQYFLEHPTYIPTYDNS